MEGRTTLLGVDALRLLSELGDVAAASNSRLSKAAFLRRAQAELACSLCHGNAGVYAGSISRLLRVAGSAVQVGEIVAMEEQRACVCRRGRPPPRYGIRPITCAASPRLPRRPPSATQDVATAALAAPTFMPRPCSPGEVHLKRRSGLRLASPRPLI